MIQNYRHNVFWHAEIIFGIIIAVSFLAQISVLFLISAFWHGARAGGKVLLNNGMLRK